MKTLSCLAAIAVLSVTVAVAQAEEAKKEIKSGLQEGKLIGAFYVTKAAGAEGDGVAVGKNLLGAVLVVVGAVLVIPGVPGQGLLTILIGLLLLDIPGKRRLELAIVRRPRVLRTINKLRKHYAKPPLVVEADAKPLRRGRGAD